MRYGEIFRLTQKACMREYFGKISREAMHLANPHEVSGLPNTLTNDVQPVKGRLWNPTSLHLCANGLVLMAWLERWLCIYTGKRG
jgi:hypothetical protein